MEELSCTKEYYNTIIESNPIVEINNEKYILISERVARKYNRLGCSVFLMNNEKLYILEDPSYILSQIKVHIKNGLKKHPNWSKWMSSLGSFNEIMDLKISDHSNDDEWEIFSIGIEIISLTVNRVNELIKIIKNHHKILKLNDISPITLSKTKNLEFYSDLFSECIYNHDINKFTYSFVSNKHKNLINDKVILKFGVIKNLIDKNKIDRNVIREYVTNKINTIKDVDEMLCILDKFIRDVTGYSFKNKAQELERLNIKYTSYDNGYILAEVLSFDEMKLVGSPQWCIAQEEYHFNYYMKVDRGINRQFIMYDFGLNPDDPFSMIGITVDLNNVLKYSYLKNDQPTPEGHQNIIKSKIPKLTENLKLDRIMEEAKTIDEILLQSVKYNSEKGLSLVKKEIRYREDSNEEEKISMLILYAKTLTTKSMIEKTTEIEIKDKINQFVDEIGLNIKNLDYFAKRRIMISNNKYLLDRCYSEDKTVTISALVDAAKCNLLKSDFFKYAYVTYLITKKVDEEIRKAVLENYLNIDKEFELKDLKILKNQEQLMLLSILVVNGLFKKHENTYNYLRKKLNLKMASEYIFEDLVKRSEISSQGKSKAIISLHNLMLFVTENNVKIDKIIMKIMIFSVRLNIEDKVDFLLSEYDLKSKSLVLTVRGLLTIDISSHSEFVFTSRLNNLEKMKWITKETSIKFKKYVQE